MVSTTLASCTTLATGGVSYMVRGMVKNEASSHCGTTLVVLVTTRVGWLVGNYPPGQSAGGLLTGSPLRAVVLKSRTPTTDRP
jgi:hypothetical protein